MARRGDKRPIHQIVNHLSAGDAIGHDVLTIQQRLQEMGHPSEIFALHTGPGTNAKAREASAYRGFSAPDNIVIWHFSIGTELTSLVAGLPDRVVMRYHNITPAEFFTGVNTQTEMECRLGRKQLAQAAGFVHLGIGDSAYNESELKELGYRATANCPIIMDLEAFRPVKPPARLAHLKQGGPNILHVGRIIPQKRYEDLIRSFYFFRRIHKGARLILVGGHGGMEVYRHALDDLAAGLGLDGVIFTGYLSQKELIASYSLAEAYLCLSDHEGFCVPLIEAMHVGLPVVSKKSTAVTETLGPAGLLLDDPSPAETAEALSAVISDSDLRGALLKAQRQRVESFQPERVWERFWSLLQPLVEEE